MGHHALWAACQTLLSLVVVTGMLDYVLAVALTQLVVDSSVQQVSVPEDVDEVDGQTLFADLRLPADQYSK